jgi:hypothetical protein
VEIACDLIATYWLGPAYAWTNLRLCFARTDVYSGVDTHPADHARQAAIEKMLNKMGFSKEAADVNHGWSEMVSVSKQTKPQAFDIQFPVQVLDALVASVHGYCLSKKLNAYDPGKQTVAALINAAWTEFMRDPTTFAAWEAKALAELDKRLPP